MKQKPIIDQVIKLLRMDPLFSAFCMFALCILVALSIFITGIIF